MRKVLIFSMLLCSTICIAQYKVDVKDSTIVFHGRDCSSYLVSKDIELFRGNAKQFYLYLTAIQYFMESNKDKITMDGAVINGHYITVRNYKDEGYNVYIFSGDNITSRYIKCSYKDICNIKNKLKL